MRGPLYWPITIALAGAKPRGWRDHAVAKLIGWLPVWTWRTSKGIDRWMRW